MKTIGRRTFLGSALLGVAVPSMLSSCKGTKGEVKKNLNQYNVPNGTTILFQGDSITDAGRNKNEYSPNKTSTFGSGYVFLASAELLNSNAGKGIKIYNKGVDANVTAQLRERWEDDCINIKPDILSILIGVNECWGTLAGRHAISAEDYEKEYELLLKDTKEKLPETKLVICEPFVLKTGAVNDSWFPVFDEYRAVSKKMAKKFNALFVPFQEIFNDALEHAPEEYWTSDGIHTSISGSKLMADAWLEVVTQD